MENDNFFDLFNTEYDCQKYLYNLRWPDGRDCPFCRHKKARLLENGKIVCCFCDYEMSVRDGIILENSRLSLMTWFNALWYASSAKFPGKVKVQTYETLDEIKSNRPALVIKQAIEQALSQPLTKVKLEGYVEVSVMPIKVKNIFLYLVVAGELQGRTVLRMWATLHAKKPKSVYDFIEKNISIGAIISCKYGIADDKKLKVMGYETAVHREQYYCKTIENKAYDLEKVVQRTSRLSEANKMLNYTCARRNSLYTPITFEDLVQRIAMLPAKSSTNKKAVE